MNRHIGALSSYRQANRRELIERLIASGSTREQLVNGLIVLGNVRRVVIVDLMVVPRDDPRRGRVSSL